MKTIESIKDNPKYPFSLFIEIKGICRDIMKIYSSTSSLDCSYKIDMRKVRSIKKLEQYDPDKSGAKNISLKRYEAYIQHCKNLQPCVYELITKKESIENDKNPEEKILYKDMLALLDEYIYVLKHHIKKKKNNEILLNQKSEKEDIKDRNLKTDSNEKENQKSD